jgi:hypothetical protein
MSFFKQLSSSAQRTDFSPGKGSAWPIRPIPTARVWHGLLGSPTRPRGTVTTSGDGIVRDPRGSEVVEGDGGPGLCRARRGDGGSSAMSRFRRRGWWHGVEDGEANLSMVLGWGLVVGGGASLCGGAGAHRRQRARVVAALGWQSGDGRVPEW